MGGILISRCFARGILIALLLGMNATKIQGIGNQHRSTLEGIPVKFVIWERSTRTMLTATNYASEARALLAHYGRERAYMTTV